MSSENKNPGATALGSEKNDSAVSAGMPSRWLARKLYEMAGEPEVRIRLWDGTDIGSDSPAATLVIHDRSTLMRVLVHPDLYFGEAYMHGGLEIDGDLVRFLEAVNEARARVRAGNRALDKLAYSVFSRARSNSLAGSRDNIHHHYDLGNDFYRLWLDREAMQYTCAYYPDAQTTLEEAQVAKLDHVCRKLQLKPGDRVVEAGCGWGGLARHMARHYGVTVRAFNISERAGEIRPRAGGVAGPGRARSNTSRTTIAISAANTTRSFRLACSSTWAPIITQNCRKSSIAHSRPRVAV